MNLILGSRTLGIVGLTPSLTEDVGIEDWEKESN